MSFYPTALRGASHSRPVRFSNFVALLTGLVLLPALMMAQEGSTIEAEVAPNEFQFCGSITEPVMLPSILTNPASPTAGNEVMFRIRKNSIGTPSENLALDAIQLAPSVSGPFQPRTESQVSFRSNPPVPMSFPDGGQQTFQMFFVPPEVGVYRFTFTSDLWDGGSCSVDVPVTSSDCLISSIEGVGPAGASMPNVLDFGGVPVGEQATGNLLFHFSQPFPGQEGIAFTSVQTPPFHLADGFSLSPSGEEGFWDVAFAPDAPDSFEDTVGFIAVRDQGKPECFVDVRLAGVGELAGVSISFDQPECGNDLVIGGVIRNLGSSPLQGLAVSAPSGYELSPSPAGSFNVDDFPLGAQGSESLPSELRFLLRFVGPGSSGQQVVAVTRSEEIITERVIPQTACIQILEPADLTLNYGDVVVDNQALQTIIAANRGNRAAMVTANLASSGAEQGFGLGLERAASATLDLGPASEELLPVSFVPPSTGAKMSTVDFTSSQFSGIPSVNLNGNGVDQPTPSLSFQIDGTVVNPGGTIRFPSTELGQSSTAPLTVTNNGNLGVLGLGLSAVNGEFGVVGIAPAELSPGQSANFMLSFQPQQAGMRSGQLTVTSESLDPVVFTLSGEGVMGELTVNGIGLNTNVSPAQTPLPTVGLELAGGAAEQAMEGDLIVEFVPNLPQTPNGFVEAYPAVRFMMGGGANGRTMHFQFNAGQAGAVFPAEGTDAQQARYQTGSVAGSIQFRIANLQTMDGSPVVITNPLVGSVTVGRLAPSIRSMSTPQTATGINVVVEAISTTRAITGVCLALTAAPNTDLSFTRPDAGFLNEPFVQWFNGSDSFPFGGDFRLTIPIDITNMQTFGSAQVWLRNSEGWSSANSPCP